MSTVRSYRFGKEEKLKSRKAIETLFATGKKLNVYPVRCIWKTSLPATGYKVAVSVSSKTFKRAVDRNRIKRMMRECWRLNKHLLTDSSETNQPMNLFFMYTGKELPYFQPLQLAFQNLLEKLSKQSGEQD